MSIRRLSPRTLRIVGLLLIVALAPIASAFAQASHSADVVQRILKYRTELALSEEQFTRLSRLESTLREETGRQVLVAFNRVPGKFVPRYVRRRTSKAEAIHQATALISPAHREHARLLISGDSARAMPQ